MNKTEIIDAYAVEQGFDSWYDFALHYKEKGYSTHSFLKHQNKVIDLVQKKLLDKVANDLTYLENDEVIFDILNTEIL